MAYKICIADSFERDLELVTAYITNVLQNPSAAANLIDKAEETVSLIKQHPFMFSLFSDETLSQKGYRNAPVSHYELFYRIDEDAETVYILRFLYAGRDMSSIL